MEMPLLLQHMLDQTLEAVREDKEHNLLPFNRLELYEAFGPLPVLLDHAYVLECGVPELSVSHKAIGQVAILSARHVLPLWEQALPGNREPHKMLEIAEAILTETVTREQLALEVWSGFQDEIALQTPNIPCSALYAAYAVCEALNMVIGDMPFQNANDITTATDDLIEPTRGDGATAASIAYSIIEDRDADLSLLRWDRRFITKENAQSDLCYIDLEKRREFWEWWLKTAISSAWSKIP